MTPEEHMSPMESEYHQRLKRLKEALDGDQTPETQDVEFLVKHSAQVDAKLLEVVDLLRQSRDAFRSKQVERARKILEELL
jgi:hypothetical protein